MTDRAPALAVGLRVTLPIRTRSPNGGNPGSRWAAIAQSREKREHRQLAHQVLGAALARRSLTGKQLAPVLVTMTRVSSGRLDDDNLAFSMKACRDGVADALGINDGDRALLRFRYAQRKGARGEYAVEVLVEHEVRSKSEFRRLQVQRGGGGETS